MYCQPLFYHSTQKIKLWVHVDSRKMSDVKSLTHITVPPNTYFVLKAKLGGTQCKPSIEEDKAEMMGRGQPGYTVSFRLD